MTPLMDRLTFLKWRLGAHLFPPVLEKARPIIVGGCGRSGTTLIRVILDSHPEICCGPESGIFRRGRYTPQELAAKFDIPEKNIRKLAARHSSHAEFIAAFFALYAKKAGKPRWADKSPKNVRRLEYIFRIFPRAKFIHMIRDGRDTICSLRTHPRHKLINNELVPTNRRNPLSACIQRWVSDVGQGLAYANDPRSYALHYEDLIRSPEQTLKDVFRFLKIEWSEAVLEYHRQRNESRDIRKFPQNPEATRPLFSGSIGRWKRDLSPKERRQVQARAGDLLMRLGYVRDGSWIERSD